jgi:hypothetical protein
METGGTLPTRALQTNECILILVETKLGVLTRRDLLFTQSVAFLFLRTLFELIALLWREQVFYFCVQLVRGPLQGRAQFVGSGGFGRTIVALPSVLLFQHL